MPVNRMNREEFFSKLTGLDEERLKKALWNLYWRGNATLRERIEAELEPETPKKDHHANRCPGRCARGGTGVRRSGPVGFVPGR